MVNVHLKKVCVELEVTVSECGAGILVSVKTRADQRIHKLKESYDHLVQRVTELQERTDKLVIPQLLHTMNQSHFYTFTSIVSLGP